MGAEKEAAVSVSVAFLSKFSSAVESAWSTDISGTPYCFLSP